MVDGNISDASPPRRRTRRDDTTPSAKRNHATRLSQPRHHEATSSVRTHEASDDSFVQDGADKSVKEDVSDASPPRQRRRISHLTSQDSLTNNTIPAKNLSPRRSRPGSSILPDEAVSMRSVEVSALHQRADQSYSGYLATSGSKRTVNTVRAPRNRFGIKPGLRWDGVNRSNGFEERLEAMQSMRKDVELEGYRASVADL